MRSMIGNLFFAVVLATVTGNLFMGAPTTVSSVNQPVFNVGNIGQDPTASSSLAGINSVLSSLGGSQSSMSMSSPSLGGTGPGADTMGNALNSGSTMAMRSQTNWGNAGGFQQQQQQQQQTGFNNNPFGGWNQNNPLLWWWMGNQFW